jgi:tetratricopeptide (TPR) repeat protein
LLVAGCASESPKPVQEEEQAPQPEVSVSRPAAGSSAAKAMAAKGEPGKRFADALALLKDHKYTDAQKGFADLAADYPQFSGALTNLGILLSRNPATRDKALAAFAQAVKDRPDNAVAQNWLGMLQRQSGQYAAAEQSYLAALKVSPDYGYAHLNLAVLYDVYLKRPQDAVAQYQAYQQHGGQNDVRVAAWLKQIERAKSNTSADSSAGADAKPSAPPAGSKPPVPAAGAKSSAPAVEAKP